MGHHSLIVPGWGHTVVRCARTISAWNGTGRVKAISGSGNDDGF